MSPLHAKVVIGLFIIAAATSAQQLALPRIDLMPNQPSPYLMRDWKAVVLAYDSLAFQEGLTGEALPLVTVVPNGINYPSDPAFLLRSYVGTSQPATSEAINALPALVGATLAGHDMRTFLGRDWVTMSRDWFNDRPQENVYLNGPTTSSGDDWWYDTMPNIFFYQLASLYPRTDAVTSQFGLVAGRWLAALRSMGGSTAPWHVPGIAHRGWKLSTMTANDAGVVEPEAAGAIAWLEYSAYTATGDPRYRVGAEWAVEALNACSSNPAYELQLSYGVQTAARMNAELNTTYDLAKLLSWCFEVGPLRSWGAVVGSWGGLDCSGLIGEVNGTNDYAFAMNTFQQIAALAPVARYDERFARAIGKWVLNAANASRLFYTAYLPDSLQDSEVWAHAHDPRSVIAHEALRESVSGAAPYATGDAIAGGWSSTNLSLYSSSSAGYLAAVVDTTDVPGILRLDLLTTDFYRPAAYPTVLLYNPNAEVRAVALTVGDSTVNVYDLVSNATLAAGVTGTAAVNIPADGAVVAVLVPSGATLTTDRGRLLADGIVVDYHSGVPTGNRPPRIKALGVVRDTVVRQQTIEIFNAHVDPDGDLMTGVWSSTAGPIVGDENSAAWQAPDTSGPVTIRCELSDGNGGTAADSIVITVLDRINAAPAISSIRADQRRLEPGGAAQLECVATDANGDSLTYAWSASAGTVQGSGSTATWTAPGAPANAFVRCAVADGFGGSTVDSLAMMVRTPRVSSGSLLAFYPCDGNALDASGSGRDGIASAVTSTMDAWGRASRALSFNGSTSMIRVAADSVLNCRSAITVAFWMKLASLPPREQYPVSHGNWNNRWKVSISNQGVRWTVKTTAGVKDLDSESKVVIDSLVHVAAVYDGADMELYLNGRLDAFTTWSGDLLTSTIDMTIGQSLPTDLAYGFSGMLDEVRVYDYALAPEVIATLPTLVTRAEQEARTEPVAHGTLSNAPNPFNPSTVISFDLAFADEVRLTVVDMLGRTVAVLSEGPMSSGRHSVRWDASGRASGVYALLLQTTRTRTVHKMLVLR